MENGNERSATLQDNQVLTFDDSNGQLSIETDDFAYDKRAWILKISQKSELSTVVGLNEATYEISVEF